MSEVINLKSNLMMSKDADSRIATLFKFKSKLKFHDKKSSKLNLELKLESALQLEED